MVQSFNIQKENGVDYTGPIDILLNLIDKQKLEVTEVSLINITKQFVSYVEQEVVDINEMAEFLYVLSVLLLIKSNQLIDSPSEESDELKIEEFKDKLKELQRIKILSSFVYQRIIEPTPFINRRFIARPEKKAYHFDYSKVNFEQLAGIFNGLDKEYWKIENLERKIEQRRMNLNLSIRDKIKIIGSFIKKEKNISFKRLCDENRSRFDVIVSFLAVLEMTKNNIVQISQKKEFHDIIVASVG